MVCLTFPVVAFCISLSLFLHLSWCVFVYLFISLFLYFLYAATKHSQIPRKSDSAALWPLWLPRQCSRTTTWSTFGAEFDRMRPCAAADGKQGQRPMASSDRQRISNVVGVSHRRARAESPGKRQVATGGGGRRAADAPGAQRNAMRVLGGRGARLAARGLGRGGWPGSRVVGGVRLPHGACTSLSNDRRRAVGGRTTYTSTLTGAGGGRRTSGKRTLGWPSGGRARRHAGGWQLVGDAACIITCGSPAPPSPPRTHPANPLAGTPRRNCVFTREPRATAARRGVDGSHAAWLLDRAKAGVKRRGGRARARAAADTTSERNT